MPWGFEKILGVPSIYGNAELKTDEAERGSQCTQAGLSTELVHQYIVPAVLWGSQGPVEGTPISKECINSRNDCLSCSIASVSWFPSPIIFFFAIPQIQLFTTPKIQFLKDREMLQRTRYVPQCSTFTDYKFSKRIWRLGAQLDQLVTTFYCQWV